MQGINKVIGRPRVMIAVMGALLLMALANWGAPTNTISVVVFESHPTARVYE